MRVFLLNMVTIIYIEIEDTFLPKSVPSLIGYISGTINDTNFIDLAFGRLKIELLDNVL